MTARSAGRRHVNQDTGEIVDDPEIRPFAAFLQERAATHDELSEALWDLVARCADTRKKGSLTLTIAIEPAKDAPDVLMVSDEIKLKLPEYPRPSAIYWADGQGNLSRTNPQQPELDGLRALPDNVTITAKDIDRHA